MTPGEQVPAQVPEQAPVPDGPPLKESVSAENAFQEKTGWERHGCKTGMPMPKGKDSVWKELIPFGLEPVAVIEDAVSGEERGVRVNVHEAGEDEPRNVVVPMALLGADRPRRELLGLRLPGDDGEVRWLKTWLSAARHSGVLPSEKALDGPAWVKDGERDRFVVPGVTPGIALTGGPLRYGTVNPNCKEDEARELWAEALRIVIDLRLWQVATLLGAAWASPHLDRVAMAVANFIVHLFGGSSLGKTSTALLALSPFGNPAVDEKDGLGHTWNLTDTNIVSKLRDAAPMPVLLDETGSINRREADALIQTVVFAHAAGEDRGRNNRDGSQREQKTWRSSLISTGERRLDLRSDMGVRVRTLQLQDLGIPDAWTADRFREIARRAYGWPLRRFAAAENQIPFPPLPSLVGETTGANRIAPYVAVSAAGFTHLCAIVGVQAPDPAEWAQSVLDTLTADLKEAGESGWDRLRTAVAEDRHRNAGKWYSRTGIPTTDFASGWHGKDVSGAYGPGWLAVFPVALSRLGEELGLSDVGGALREARERGHMHWDEGEFTKRVRFGDGQPCMHVVYVGDEGVTGTPGHGGELEDSSPDPRGWS